MCLWNPYMLSALSQHRGEYRLWKISLQRIDMPSVESSMKFLPR